MMEITFRPIDQWSGPLTRNRKPSQFKAGYDDTMRVLDTELYWLTARKIVIQLALPLNQIRLDGLPYSTAKPVHPGVILSFESKHGPLQYPCDTFTDWRDNLRAIALALEALRKVDRYGVTRRAEQYKGWAQLPPPATAMKPSEMSIEEAATTLHSAALGGFPIRDLTASSEMFRTAFRAASRMLHPDNNQGRELPQWHQLQRAGDVLKRHHGC